jgi:DNA-binding transcriptional LysR family regulator
MVLDIRQLQHVAAIGRFRSFALAAESLRISQPALSKSLKVIERSLEVRLFDRGRRGVTPTAFGELLLARAGPLFRGLDEALAELRQLRGLDSGSLAVGAGPFPFELSVAAAAAAMARRHPGLMLRVVQGDWDSLTREVLAGSLDLAVAEVSDAEQEPRLSVERLGPRGGLFYCRAGHPLLALPAPAFEDFAGFPLAMNRLPGRVARFFERSAMAGRLDPLTGHFLPSITVDSVVLMVRIVGETDTVSWAPRALIATGLRAGALVALPTAPAWARLNYGIIRRADRPATPAVEAFVAELRAIEERIPRDLEPPLPARRPTRRG